MKYSIFQKTMLGFVLLAISSYVSAASTPISLYKSFEGNIAVAAIGNSELTETGGTGNCGNDNATTATLALPAGAQVKAAYLYWYAMTANITWGDSFGYGALSQSAPVTFPAYTGTINSSRKISTKKFSWEGYWKYSGYFADVTSQVTSGINGNYTVDVQGGASSSACPLVEENARSWSLIVIYEAPSITENKKIYVYDGIKGYQNESISIPVSGYEVPAISTAGSMTVISIQGDPGLDGEYLNTSDTSFPSFPSDFADSDHGAALDIDTVSGNFTAGSTSMSLDSGSIRDLIFTTNIILSIPTVPTAQCFAMPDNAAELYSFDLKTTTAPTVVATTKMLNGEGSAYRATDNAIYAFHQDVISDTDPSDLYKVQMDGTVTLIKAGFLSQAAVGGEFIRYEDGSEYFYVLQNQGSSSLLKFDAKSLSTGTPISTTALLFPDTTAASVSGLAINPVTGEILVSDDSLDSTDFVEIYTVNQSSGQLTLKTTLTVAGIDGESLAFSENGDLYTENESAGAAINDNKIFKIDLATGNLTEVETNINAVVNGDIEAMSCTGSKLFTKNSITNLTIVTKIINDNSGTQTTMAGLNVTTDAGSLTFGSGTTTGSTTSFTSSAVTINEGRYQLSATNLANYTTGDWSCSGSSGVTLNQIFVEGSAQANVFIPNGDNVTCTITYDDDGGSSCSAGLTGDINAGFTPAAKLKSGAKVFLSSTNISSNEGHLKAYTIASNGLPTTSSSNLDWDASTAMHTQNKRGKRLFSTQGGNKKKFKKLNNNAFGSVGLPSNDQIKDNVANALLGAISPNSNLGLLDDKVDVARYLSDADYKAFYTDIASARSDASGATSPKLVLLSSDDGFVYAFRQNNGYLHWGWTPRSLVKEMRNASKFIKQHYMQGTIDVMDLKDGSNYASYVVGSYRDGLGQYVLKLKDNGKLDSIVWDTDHKDSNSLAESSPNHGKRAYFSDGSGNKYIAYIITNSSDESTLHIRSIVSTSVHYQINLGFTATSTPFIMPVYQQGGVAGDTMYLGDSNGNIYSAPLLVTSGSSKGDLNSESTLDSAFSQNSVAALHTSDSSAVQFIGASASKAGNTIYLHAQSKDRLSIFTYQPATANSSASWRIKWTTSTSGSNKWDTANNTLTSDASITVIPTGAMITDDSYVVANSLVVPVTLAATGTNCDGAAYYYLYQLTDGHVPTETFYNTSDNSAITSRVSLGKGTARRLHVAEHPSSKKLIGLGISDQTSSGSTGVGSSVYIEDPVSTGVRSWEILQ